MFNKIAVATLAAAALSVGLAGMAHADAPVDQYGFVYGPRCDAATASRGATAIEETTADRFVVCSNNDGTVTYVGQGKINGQYVSIRNGEVREGARTLFVFRNNGYVYHAGSDGMTIWNPAGSIISESPAQVVYKWGNFVR